MNINIHTKGGPHPTTNKMYFSSNENNKHPKVQIENNREGGKG